MEERLVFKENEIKETLEIIRILRSKLSGIITEDDETKVFEHVKQAIANNHVQRNIFGLNPILLSLQTALVAVEEIGLKRDGTIAILLYASTPTDDGSINSIKETYGDSVGNIIHSLRNIQELYKKNPVIES